MSSVRVLRKFLLEIHKFSKFVMTQALFFSNAIFVWEKNRLDSSLSQLRLPRRPLLLLLVINPQSKSSSKSLAVNEVEFLAHNYRLLLIGSRSILRHTWLRQFFLLHQLNWIGWCYATQWARKCKKVQAKQTRESWNPINQFHDFFFTKFHFLPFQKWPKINFWTGKKF